MAHILLMETNLNLYPTAPSDFIAPSDTSVFIDTTTPRQCFTFDIVNDNDIESTENLTVTIFIEDTEMELIIDPVTTTILIQDDDRKYQP